MNRKKILVVFGTRPEAIKMAPVVRALRQRGDRAETRVVSTGQHREMLQPIVEFFGLAPDEDLGLMRPSQSLAGITSDAIAGFDRCLSRFAPEIVLVQGDTTTAMSCALAAYYRKIAVGHVEAGLRTGDRYRPFPEEINRRVITTVSSWNFAPTERARRALLAEGIAPETIHVTGNTVIDSLLEALARPAGAAVVPPFPSKGRRLVLVTAHRRESFGGPFEALCQALRSLASRVEDIEIVYPVHLNPNVQGPVRRILGDRDRIHLLAPLDYLAFARLLQRATLVLTDSGGVQEEAPSLRVPVLVLREETERPEAVEAGFARLVGTDPSSIVPAAVALLTDEPARLAMIRGESPFGDGTAAERIARLLLP